MAGERRKPADEAPKKVAIAKNSSLCSIDQTDVEPFKGLDKYQF